MFLGEKLIIPAIFRKEMLNLVHESHQGIEKSKARAREVIYWPGMARDIEDTMTRFTKCAECRRNNQKEPLIPHEVPTRPWQKLGADLFDFTCVLCFTTPSFLKSVSSRPKQSPQS